MKSRIKDYFLEKSSIIGVWYGSQYALEQGNSRYLDDKLTSLH